MKTREISCSEVLAPIECINPRRDRWAVRWNHHRDEERGWLAVEMITDGRPTIDEIRDAVAEYFDAQTPFIGLLEADTDAAAADELGDMVAAMWTHIKECRAAGIEAKNAVDYSQYEL